MINVSTISVNAGFGQSSAVQGRGQDVAGDAASDRFPPLAGFERGGDGDPAKSAPLPARGFGGAATQGGGGRLADGGSEPSALAGHVEGLAEGQPQPAGEFADAAVEAGLQPGYGAPAGASVETGAMMAGYAGAGPVSGDADRGFSGSGLAVGWSAPSPRGGLDGLQQAQNLLSPQSQPQGQSQNHSALLSQNQAHGPVAQTGSQELARAMASLIGNGGLQATALRGGLADGAALGQAAQGAQAQGIQVDNPLLATGGTRGGAVAVPEWSPVKVDVQQAHWGRDLMAALAERVEMQLSQQIKQARIRLDPPELGRLQLTVRLDGDRLSVQFNASHAQVREALAHQQDRLRADLAGEYGQGVEVSVGQEQGQQRSPAGDQPWDAPETVAEIGSLAVEGDLDGSEAGPGRAVSSRGGKDWVSALA